MSVRGKWLDHGIFFIENQGFVAADALQNVLSPLEQALPNESIILLVDFSETMYSRSFAEHFIIHNRFMRLIDHPNLHYAVFVVPGVDSNPVAHLIREHHRRLGNVHKILLFDERDHAEAVARRLSVS